MRIVINRSHSGYGLSPLAFGMWAERSPIAQGYERVYHEKDKQHRFYLVGPPFFGVRDIIDDNEIERNDMDLIAVVEELGDRANAPGARLKIVEIPDDVVWDIEESDGIEIVSEEHRTWC